MKIADDIEVEQLIKTYYELNSSYKVATFYNVSATAVKRILKNAGVLRTQKQAATERPSSNFKGKRHTTEVREVLSANAKLRVGEKNPFYGRKHSTESKLAMSEVAKTRKAEKNPNFKQGKNIRRPRDFKNAELQKLRSFVFNRDHYTCFFCKTKGGHLHAHHKLPFWVKPEAFLDVDNLITVCTKCHFEKAHVGNWQCFSMEIVDDGILVRYSLCRERLNELATLYSGCDSLDSSNI